MVVNWNYINCLTLYKEIKYFKIVRYRNTNCLSTLRGKCEDCKADKFVVPFLSSYIVGWLSNLSPFINSIYFVHHYHLYWLFNGELYSNEIQYDFLVKEDHCTLFHLYTQFLWTQHHFHNTHAKEIFNKSFKTTS